MEKKTISYETGDRYNKTRSFVVVKRWCMVHAKSGTLAIHRQGRETSATLAECQRRCDDVMANNGPDILARFFPEGVRPAPWWCYDWHFDPHSSVEPIPTFVTIRERKGVFKWSIHEVREKPLWIEGERTLEKTKAAILDLFPDATIDVEKKKAVA